MQHKPLDYLKLNEPVIFYGTKGYRILLPNTQKLLNEIYISKQHKFLHKISPLIFYFYLEQIDSKDFLLIVFSKWALRS